MQNAIHTATMPGGEMVRFFAPPVPADEEPAWVSVADLMKAALGQHCAGFEERHAGAHLLRTVQTPEGEVQIASYHVAVGMLNALEEAGVIDEEMCSAFVTAAVVATGAAHEDKSGGEVLACVLGAVLDGPKRYVAAAGV